jgi:hypothetical protein
MKMASFHYVESLLTGSPDSDLLSVWIISVVLIFILWNTGSWRRVEPAEIPVIDITVSTGNEVEAPRGELSRSASADTKAVDSLALITWDSASPSAQANKTYG